MAVVHLISLETLYLVCGAFLLIVAVGVARRRDHPRRWGSALFWLLLAFVFLAGKRVPPVAVGYILVVLVLLAAARQVVAPRVVPSSAAVLKAEAVRLGNRLFIPALVVPLTAMLGSFLLPKLHIGDLWLTEPRHATLVALGLGAVAGLLLGVRLLGASPGTPVREGSRLIELVSWTMILPQMLAALGGVFQKAGVGPVVAELTAAVVPSQSAFAAVVAYCVAMALFTVFMGNAFAAFAVITGGIGLPLIVQQHHGNAAIMAAVGMLSGYCGTLLTPMAANFNIVPAVLLELRDKNAVIKAQAPIAFTLLAANILIMYVCVYRF